MRTAVPTDASLLVRDARNGAGPGGSLRAGAFVSVEVRERLGPSLYRITVGSRSLVASSEALLQPGVLVRAKVERSGDALILRLVDAGKGSREALDAALLKAGLPRDDAGRAALTALLAAGVSPDAAALGRVRRAALRSAAGRDEAGLVELAARMEAKLMPADDEALSALARAGDGREGGGSGPGADGGGSRPDPGADGGSRGEDGRGDADSRLEGGLDLDRDLALSIPAAELPKTLGLFLKALATRVAPSPAGRAAADRLSDADRLGVFNHAKGGDGGWIIMPFSFALDSVAFKGGLRVQLPRIPGGRGRIELRFDAESGSDARAWCAALAYGGGAGATLRMSAPDGAGGRRYRSRFESFARELAAVGCAAFAGGPDDEAPSRRGGVDVDA